MMFYWRFNRDCRMFRTSETSIGHGTVSVLWNPDVSCWNFQFAHGALSHPITSYAQILWLMATFLFYSVIYGWSWFVEKCIIVLLRSHCQEARIATILLIVHLTVLTTDTITVRNALVLMKCYVVHSMSRQCYPAIYKVSWLLKP